jgi:hypothetical protein
LRANTFSRGKNNNVMKSLIKSLNIKDPEKSDLAFKTMIGNGNGNYKRIIHSPDNHTVKRDLDRKKSDPTTQQNLYNV